MDKRKEAKEMLHKLRACRPKSSFGQIEECHQGVGFVLAYLQEAEHEVIAGELARELNVSTARIAALLRKMEKNGLIIRHRSDTDARQTVVELTRTGKDYVEKMKETILAKMEMLLEKVGKEDMEEFIRISRKIRNALEE